MDYKEETKSVYNNFPEHFDEKFDTYTNEIIVKELDEVVKTLKPGSKILDIGSGPGNHSIFLKNKGFDVLCLDTSEELLKICEERGLKTIKQDYEDLQFQDESFDAIWAYTSLLHSPKDKIPEVLDKISNILKKEGYLFLSLKEGTESKMFDFKLGGKRWFSLYTDEEIRELLEDKFEIIKHWKVPIAGKTFLDYFCRKLS